MAQSYINDYLELPPKIQLNEETEFTMELVDKLIKKHEESIGRYETLQNYYKAKALIYDRQKDEGKSNNKLVFDFASYIVDTLSGLFVGRPITYTASDELKDYLASIQEVLDANDEQDENTEIAKMAGINGRAYEVVYVDEDKNICFNEVNPKNIIFVYDNKIKPEPLMAIYLKAQDTLQETKTKDATVYTRDKVYELKTGDDGFYIDSEMVNVFGEVNVIEFMNNDEGIGDFERVISLIDEYNLLQSDTSNDFEEFTDAILLLYGMLNANSEDLEKIKSDRVILMDAKSGQDASWLVKQINDTALFNYKASLDDAIHKFSKVPNMSDENFAGNVSGESMKYKLFATDQVISQKQRKFNSALSKRLRLISKILGLKGKHEENYKEISINFQDNRPYNELDNVTMVQGLLNTGASKTLAFSKLKGIDNVEAELERQMEEQSAYADIYLRADDESVK